MDKACGETVVVVTVPAAAQLHHGSAPPPPPHDPTRQMKLLRLSHAFGHCIRLAVLGAVAYGLVRAAHLAGAASDDDEPRRRHHGRDELALLAAVYAVLLAVLVLVLAWLRRAGGRLKQLAVDYGVDEKRWAKKAARGVVLDLVVIATFFRVAELVPPAMSALVWCPLAIFACACVYVVAFGADQYWRDRALGDVVDSDDAAGDVSKAVEKISRSADEKV